ncbi:MAG: intradiol ring-cleavage dioxygenase [Bacteroidota bacterium]
MLNTTRFSLILFLLCIHYVSYSQPILGGPCQGCEAIYDYGQQPLSPTDTLPGFHVYKPKLMIEGTVFQADGRSPAEGVILYVYHTNREGIYKPKEGQTGWASIHGHIRGWMQTGPDGFYRFYTFLPAPYPDGRAPAHIHITVKEPLKRAYYLDSFFFSNDPLLTPEKIATHTNRGGSGILTLVERRGIWTARRDIILGENIPNYP